MQTFHDPVSAISGLVSLVIAAALLGIGAAASGAPVARSAIDWRAAPAAAMVPLPTNSSIALKGVAREDASPAYRIVVPPGATLSVSLLAAAAPIALLVVDEQRGAVLFDANMDGPLKPIEVRGPRPLLIAVSARQDDAPFTLFMQMK